MDRFSHFRDRKFGWRNPSAEDDLVVAEFVKHYRRMGREKDLKRKPAEIFQEFALSLRMQVLLRLLDPQDI